MENKPKILSNELDQAPKTWEQYQERLNEPNLKNEIRIAMDKHRETKEKYLPQSEWKVDIHIPEVKDKIEEWQSLYNEFMSKFWEKLDFENPISIWEVYEKAQKMWIFKKAKELRELIFWKDMHFYWVVYLWDWCINDCSFCPWSKTNKAKAKKEGKVYETRKLTPQQWLQETMKVMKDWHSHVCFLTGSNYPNMMAKHLIPYLKVLDTLWLEEIILNIEPPTQEWFEQIRAAVKNTSLQFRVFQETYDKDTYARLMNPNNRDPKKIPKADYQFRYDSQKRALKAWFENVWLWVLFWLSRFPLKEIEALKKHNEELENEFWRQAIRLCLPSANEISNIGIKIPFFMERWEYKNGRKELVEKKNYEKLNELLYALTRLAMPTMNIVSSERDGEAMLNILDDYATCSTLWVRPWVGENTWIFDEKKQDDDVHFEQTTTFYRDPKKTAENMKKRWFTPILQI